MSQKIRIVDTLGERSLLRPMVINAALAANDRAKYYFTLLQTAVLRAQHDGRAPDLRRERLACGVDNEKLDSVVTDASTDRDGRFRIVEGGVIVHALIGEIGVMLAPFADESDTGFRSRFDALRGRAETLQDGLYTHADIDALTSAARDSGDSRKLPRKTSTARLPMRSNRQIDR